MHAASGRRRKGARRTQARGGRNLAIVGEDVDDEREVLRGWTDDWSIRGWILVMGGFQCAMLPLQISPRFVEFLKTAEASLS